MKSYFIARYYGLEIICKYLLSHFGVRKSLEKQAIMFWTEVKNCQKKNYLSLEGRAE